MKKWIALFITLCMALSCAAGLAETAETTAEAIAEESMEDIIAQGQEAVLDGISSASVMDYFGTIMTPDELAASINSANGFYAVASVNEDNTPNIGFYIFSAAVKDEKLYLQLGLAENQTRKNIENGSTIVVMYAPLPAEGQTYPIAGARLICEKVADEALLAELMETMPQKSDLIFEVTLIRPLG